MEKFVQFQNYCSKYDICFAKFCKTYHSSSANNVFMTERRFRLVEKWNYRVHFDEKSLNLTVFKIKNYLEVFG